MTNPRTTREHDGPDELVEILSGWRDRIADAEESQTGDQSVQLFRSATATCESSDTVSVTTDSSDGFEWGASDWGFDEF